MSWFWIVYLVGVVITIGFMVYLHKTDNVIIDFKDYKDLGGLLLFGLLWPCFVLQIIIRTLDILIG